MPKARVQLGASPPKGMRRHRPIRLRSSTTAEKIFHTPRYPPSSLEKETALRLIGRERPRGRILESERWRRPTYFPSPVAPVNHASRTLAPPSEV